MQYGSATHSPKSRKFLQAHRSASTPVGMVAVVSMNTIMKKKSTMTPTSFTPLPRKNPFVPRSPYVKAPVALPAASVAAPMPMPLFSTESPGPSDGYQPGGTGPFHQLPQPMAKP